MTSVLITGAGGFIARHLVREFKKENMQTVGISRKPKRIDGFDRVYNTCLGESFKHVFEEADIDVVIHCANHVGENEFEVNVMGTTLWMEEARIHGVDLQIFLSSLLANEDVRSDYGRAKFELEKHFIEDNQVVFRPGLVVGDGGIFGKMKKTIQTLPVVPLLDNGTSKVYVTGINFLCKIIRYCILSRGEGLRGRAWRIQQSNPFTLREVMVNIRKQVHSHCIFIPLPSILVLEVLSFIEHLPFFKMSFRSTNIRGLRQSGSEHFESDFDLFGEPEKSLDELIRGMK